jgi:predicted Zn-dependent protease
MINPTDKRLQKLEELIKKGIDDPFIWYGLAHEYISRQRHDDALNTFSTVRTRFPEYVPMYLICGRMLEKLERFDDARDWLEAGRDAAKKKGDSHALGELEAAIEGLPPKAAPAADSAKT